MRTTIDIPDQLFRRIKALAAIQGITLKNFITKAVEHELISRKELTSGFRIKDPLIPSDKPGSLHITPDYVAKLMEIEDIHVSP
ncbi:MAG: hypothetical protein JXJ04_01390 [Spirochaetales bacterium]|nr:hypothetical protein [Spirochaetales bacterium]